MKTKFTSIKQIPKEAIEMIDDVRWWQGLTPWVRSKDTPVFQYLPLPERLSSSMVIALCNAIEENGDCQEFLYIEPRELEDKTFGINLYKKIHGEK